METPDRYCEECGAANTRAATTCFACSRPLDASSTEPRQSVPLDTSAQNQAQNIPLAKASADFQMPATPAYLQITLKANSQTTVQLVQPQLEPQTLTPLLHGRYKVLSQVGTGGFGAVYKARDFQAHGRMVAIKAIELDTLSASQAIEATDTFNRELGLLSNLDHPHLPGIYEHFIDETHWYLVMDFIDGEPLDEYLQQMQLTCLPLKQVLNIGLQLCDVLRYLHQLHPPVIFRDLKPANIMRTPGGRLYLIDFGIARRFKPGQAKDTTPLGSPGFAAPEQYGKAQTTTRSDIYSLGATLYFLLTGYDPANTPFHLPPIRSLCPTLPEPLAELITSMLALDPADRPASITAVQHALSNYGPSTRHTTVLAQSQVFAAASSLAAQPAPSPSHKMKSFLKGIFSVAVTCLVIAACTLTAHFMGASSFSGSSAIYNSPASVPPPPARFRVPYIGQLDSLNPFATTDPQAAELENLLFGRLVSVQKNSLAIQPGLARSWKLSSDGLHWTFYLDTNSTFSDGAPITAQDVAASFNYALASSSAPTTCPFFGLIKDAATLQTHHRSSLLGDSIVVIDPQTISFTTSRPAAYFLATLATPCGSILKKSDLSTWNKGAFPDSFMRIAFSGTYTVTGYALSSSNKLTSLFLSSLFNNYYQTQLPEQIVVQSYPDTSASYAAYTAGQLDISPVAGNLSELSQPISLTHPLTLHYYGMNYLAKPFDNISIRRAFALALAKDSLAAFSRGMPTSSLLGSWNAAGYDSAADNNPVVAKQLFEQGLKEEGLSTVSQLPPITFTYQAQQSNLTSEVELAQQEWKTLFGVEVTLRPVNHLAQAIAGTRGNASLQLWAADYTPAYPDPYALLGLPFAPDSSLNAVNYGQNTSSDAAQQQAWQSILSSDALNSTNRQLGSQPYLNADQALISDVAWLPIYMVSHPYVIKAGFASSLASQWSMWEAANDCALLPPC